MYSGNPLISCPLNCDDGVWVINLRLSINECFAARKTLFHSHRHNEFARECEWRAPTSRKPAFFQVPPSAIHCAPNVCKDHNSCDATGATIHTRDCATHLFHGTVAVFIQLAKVTREHLLCFGLRPTILRWHGSTVRSDVSSWVVAGPV